MDVKEIAVGFATTNVTLVTTSETEVVQSDEILIPLPGATVLIHGWAQLTTGVATTTVTPRIRRGVDTAGALVGEANPATIPTAAGGTDEYGAVVVDTLGNVDSVTYIMSLQQAAATGNGTALMATLFVVVLG